MSLAATATLALRGLLGIVMTAEGGLKLSGVHEAEEFEQFGYPRWFHGVVGVLELVGGAALLAGLAFGGAITGAGGVVTDASGTMTVAGGTIVAIVLAGAVASHVRVGDSAAETAPAAALLVLAGIVVATELPL